MTPLLRLSDLKPSREHLASHWVVIALLMLFTLILYRRLLLTNQVLASGDIFHYFYPYRDYASQALREGRIPLWNPYIFSGVPFLANPQAAVLYPLHWPLSWLPVTKQIYWSAALHTWLLGFGSYLLMRSARLSQYAALATALLIAGSGFYGGLVGHINQMNGAAWLPWALVVLQGRTNTRLRVAWFGVIVAMMLLAGHTQTAYINLAGIGLWLLCPQDGEWGGTYGSSLLARISVYLGGVALGTLLSLAQLLPAAELSQLGLRSGGLNYADATSFSLPLRKIIYTLMPAYGQADLSVVFGTSGYTEFVAYIGIIGVCLAAIALWKSRHALFVGAVLLAAGGLFLAIGRWNPFYWILFKLVPGFDLFRTPARWMMLYSMGMAMLGGLGFHWVETTLFSTQRRLVSNVLAVGILLLISVELTIAARALPHTHTTAPQAVWDLRTASAHLLTDPDRTASYPGSSARFLSLSIATFDPGDMDAYHRILAAGDSPQLDEQGFGQLIRAFKSQEIVAPNLSLLRRIPSVDGFDGGILPLQRYLQATSLYIPKEHIVPDGRLREQLQAIPDARLLARFNVKYVVTDKVSDLWYKDIYYDREIGAQLNTEADGLKQVIMHVPHSFEATRIDLIGFVDGPQDRMSQLVHRAETVATIALTDGSHTSPTGLLQTKRFELVVGGMDNAHWADSPIDGTLWHASGAEIAYQDVENGLQEYIARFRLDEPIAVKQVRVQLNAGSSAVQNGITVTLRAATMVDERTGMFLPLLPSDKGDFRLVHSGDVKIYENLEVFDRVYLARDVISAQGPDAAIERVREQLQVARTRPVFGTDLNRSSFGPDPDASSPDWAVVEGMEAFQSSMSSEDSAHVVRYEPERVDIRSSTAAEALLVLSDSYYPGWKATVDGQPVPIYPANGLFRGVLLQPGEHLISFTYRPASWLWGSIGSCAGLLILGYLVFAGFRSNV